MRRPCAPYEGDLVPTDQDLEGKHGSACPLAYTMRPYARQIDRREETDGLGREAWKRLARSLLERRRDSRLHLRIPHQDGGRRPRRHHGIRPTPRPVDRPRRRETAPSPSGSSTGSTHSTSPATPRPSTAACSTTTSCPAGARPHSPAITGIAVPPGPRRSALDGYAVSTVPTITKILSMMLADAADERLIAANPIRPATRQASAHQLDAERRWATPEGALRVADNAALLLGPWAAMLLATAAWTGARWGELTGLQRTNIHLDDGCFDDRPATSAPCTRSTATSNSAHPRPPSPPARSPSRRS